MSELKQLQQLHAKLAMVYAEKEKIAEQDKNSNEPFRSPKQPNTRSHLKLTSKKETSPESLGESFAQTLKNSNTIADLAALDLRIKQLCSQ